MLVDSPLGTPGHRSHSLYVYMKFLLFLYYRRSDSLKLKRHKSTILMILFSHNVLVFELRLLLITGFKKFNSQSYNKINSCYFCCLMATLESGTLNGFKDVSNCWCMGSLSFFIYTSVTQWFLRGCVGNCWLNMGKVTVKSSMARSLSVENLLPQNVGSIIDYLQ